MENWLLVLTLCFLGQSIHAVETGEDTQSFYDWLKMLLNHGRNTETTNQFIVTDCPLNVVFLLDGSDSVSPDGFDAAKSSLVREIRVATQTFANTQLAVIFFSDMVKVEELKPRSESETENLIVQIQNFTQPRRKTVLKEAFSTAREMLQDYSVIESRAYNGMRSGSAIVMITDGYAEKRSEMLEEIMKAKSSNILILSLTVGTADLALLNTSHVVQEHTRAINWTSHVACPKLILQPVQRLRDCRDFLLVVDGSDSVLLQKETVRQYLSYTALRYRFVTNAIGINIYGTNSRLQAANTRIRLEGDKYSLAEKIRTTLQFPTSGGTGTNLAVSQSVDMLDDDLRDRPSAIILIIDGPTLDQQATRDAIKRARDSGYLVVIIRVGDVLTDEEVTLIGGDDTSNVLAVESFIQIFGLSFDEKVCNATVSGR